MDPRDLRDAFAANLRRLRHARSISQEDLAHEAGINRSYMSKLEKGASYPGLEIIAKLATQSSRLSRQSCARCPRARDHLTWPAHK
jgi:DNA-binding XRE family transcriptional regulator